MSFTARLALLLLFSAVAQPAAAQLTVRGTVTDAETGTPLPSAHVVVEGTYRGTIANTEGHYVLQVDALPATLVFRSIGYATQRHAAAPARGDGTALRLDVRLQPVAYEMEELVVTGEDPAVGIMRRVIEEKQKWYGRLETFEADAYTRYTVSNDTGVVFITETLADLFWSRARGTRTVITSYRKTENAPFGPGDLLAGFVPNLYDDDVELAGYRFVGVTHPKALDAYRFTLLRTRQIDDRLVYDIGVAPRSDLASGFTGQVTVLDGAFALLEVALRPGPAFFFPPPIEQFDLAIFQQFSNAGGDFWLPVDFRADAAVRFGFQGLVRYPAARLRQTSRLTDYEVNVSLPDTLYAQDSYMTVDAAAVAADTLLAHVAAAVPLDAREAAAYAHLDSTRHVGAAFRPSGLLTRFVDMEMKFDDASAPVDAGPAAGRTTGSGIRFLPAVRYNRVEGAHAGLQASRAFGPLRVEAETGWSTALDGDDAWSRRVALTLDAGPAERLVFGLSAEVAPAARYESVLYPAALTSVHALLGGTDYYDYYGRRQLVAQARYRPAALPLAASLAFTAERPHALAANTGYDLLGRPGPPPANPPVAPADVRSGTARLTLGEPRYTFGVERNTYAVVEVERGRTNGAGGAWFTRYAVEAEYAIPTFFRRRLIPAVLHVRLDAGFSTGRLPIQRHGIVDARLGAYTPFGALRTRAGRPYEGDRHVGLFWEQSLRSLPFEVLGLYGPARRGYTVLVHGAHARTWLSDEAARTAVFHVPGGFHHEVGLSLSGLLGVLRLDLTKRLDAPGFSVGVAAARFI